MPAPLHCAMLGAFFYGGLAPYTPNEKTARVGGSLSEIFLDGIFFWRCIGVVVDFVLPSPVLHEAVNKSPFVSNQVQNLRRSFVSPKADHL